ncbi:glutamine--tRNA ligase/YqeY domain fusion protein [Xylophilus sp.]|uniref:glutamine--tRNA ligase/YqeY domain fusion protein n=1 Tax=Xylophilus sp. TaxID=2653893 RepID=UPI0013BD182F|nr:glutamine--tRNA ligase/YqeY domain fusion protein [Xylophilus sp.]KAF1047091.1 MAG: Glutamine--tRNA ligase [Xylophilus sp.]
MSSPSSASSRPAPAAAGDADAAKPSNFLRQVIDSDLARGTYAARRWAGSPGDRDHQAGGGADPARIRTRFPPEPNGYLHIGHAKSIWLNFRLAQDYAGICHLRFDDTNPEKEEQEYVDSILDAVQWLGYGWDANATSHLYYASNYFDFVYRAALHLVETGHAYVDEQTAEQMRERRGDFTTPGIDSPFRGRTVAENLARLEDMRAGRLPDGAAVLRAKIDMASPNINLRDPAIYRIRRATHHRTGDAWCIYPMYTFAHPIEDALENITHSICTLEFEDQRPFYDWLLARLEEGGLINTPPPRQYEFARLNLTYVITSKRKLKQLVDEGRVSGWDDPRMPTIVGLRRRGYTPESLRLFAERSGVSKAAGWIDYSSLEIALRDDLDPKAARAMVVLDPVRLVVTNWEELHGVGALDACSAPVHPHHPERGSRSFQFGRELWIERTDYEDIPPKGFHRLYPGNKVRLKYGHVVECTGAVRDADGTLVEVQARLVPDTKSGTPGADAVKVKGVITWVGASDGVAAEVRLYDRLFGDPHPDAGGKDFLAALNPDSLRIVTGFVEPAAAGVAPDTRLQFERHGYFVADREDHVAGGRPVFNRITGLKDFWSK